MDNTTITNQSGFIHRLFNRIDTTNPKQLANIVYLFVAFHFLLWFCVGVFSQRAPHWDNVEALVWSQHLEWGYFKHPPIATWIVHGFVSIFGRSFWVTYLAGQLNVALMLIVVWRITLLLTTPARAATAVILTSLVIYYNIWGIVANHNTLQLLPVSLLLWSCLIAVRQPQWWRWGLVGIMAAVCLLTKYSAVIWVAVIGVWMIFDARMHRLKPWLGVFFALLIALIAIVPHVEWLMREGYQTLRYLENQTKEHTNYFSMVAKFISSQLGRVLPLLIAFAILYWTLRRDALKSSEPSAPLTLTAFETKEWRFICMMTLGPLLVVLIAGAFMMNLRANWGTTFLIFAGLFATCWLPVIDEKKMLGVAIKLGFVINLLIALWMSISNGLLVDMVGRTSRVNFPTLAFANQIDQIWSDSMGDQPLKLVAGETWLAGITSVQSKYHPVAYLYGRRIQAPWVTEKMIRDCAVLLLVDRRVSNSRPPPPEIVQMMQSATHKGMFEIPWSRRQTGPMLIIEWGIIEPPEKGLCQD